MITTTATNRILFTNNDHGVRIYFTVSNTCKEQQRPFQAFERASAHLSTEGNHRSKTTDSILEPLVYSILAWPILLFKKWAERMETAFSFPPYPFHFPILIFGDGFHYPYLMAWEIALLEEDHHQ